MGAGLHFNLVMIGVQRYTGMTRSYNHVYREVTEKIAKKVDKDRKRKPTDSAEGSRRQSKYSKVDNTTAARRAYSRDGTRCLPENATEDLPLDEIRGTTA